MFCRQEAQALDIMHLEQRNRAIEAAAELKRQAAADAQRALREQLAQANAAAQERVAREREKDRLADSAALSYMLAKQREEVARQQAAAAARHERDRAHAALLHASKKAASSQAEEDERKARLARESVVLAQRALDRAAAEKRADFMRCAKCPFVERVLHFLRLFCVVVIGQLKKVQRSS